MGAVKNAPIHEQNQKMVKLRELYVVLVISDVRTEDCQSWMLASMGITALSSLFYIRIGDLRS